MFCKVKGKFEEKIIDEFVGYVKDAFHEKY